MAGVKADSRAKNVFPGTLEAFCIQAMLRAGMTEADARATARVLVTTDTWGVHTHGTKQLRGLMKNYRDGRMRLDTHAETLSEGPGWAHFDGRHSMPMVSSVKAMQTIIAKAGKTGIATAAVKNSGHYGAAGYYANMAAEEGMIGVSMTNVDPGVAVPGARVSVLGTNPIAYAVPSGREHPLLFDIATSIVAASKVYALRDQKKPVPEGWLIDKCGLPTTDPSSYPMEGALMPMAGHKGYGIALLVEILTGLISGGAIGSEVTSWVLPMRQPVNQSHGFIVINPGVFMPLDAFKARVDELVKQIRNAPKAKDAERIYLPGEMEWEYRAKSSKDGISLPDHVLASLEGLAEDYGLDMKDLCCDDLSKE